MSGQAEGADIATSPAVLDAIRMLRRACEVAARANGEVLRTVAVLWTTGARDKVFDGGVTCSGPESDDQDFEIMAEFLEGLASGERESEVIPNMGAAH